VLESADVEQASSQSSDAVSSWPGPANRGRSRLRRGRRATANPPTSLGYGADRLLGDRVPCACFKLPHRHLGIVGLGGYLQAGRLRELSAKAPRGPQSIYIGRHLRSPYEARCGRNATPQHGLAPRRALAQPLSRADPAASATLTDGHPGTASSFRVSSIDPSTCPALAELGRAGFGEVELHLHHDRGRRPDQAKARHSALNLRRFARARASVRARPNGQTCAYGFQFTAIGAWQTAVTTVAGAASISELRVLVRGPAATPISHSVRARRGRNQTSFNQIYWPTGDPRERRATSAVWRARVGRVMG